MRNAVEKNMKAWRRKVWQMLRRLEERRESIAKLICVMLLMICSSAAITVASPLFVQHAQAVNAHLGCRALMVWPVQNPKVIAPFDKPDKPWLAGHRGVDLSVADNKDIRAPDDGVIRFVGIVAGKSVVSIQHTAVISTFEPATTPLSVGDPVTRGQIIAYAEGESDHCSDQCIHWGVRNGKQQYLDPESLTARRTVVLKPVRFYAINDHSSVLGKAAFSSMLAE